MVFYLGDPSHRDGHSLIPLNPATILLPFSMISFMTTHSPITRERWRSLVSVLCMVVLMAPTASCLPLSLVLQFRLVSEEEVHTVGETLVVTTEVRRKTAKLPKSRPWPIAHDALARVRSSHVPAGDQSEHRLLNGTGAPLRC